MLDDPYANRRHALVRVEYGKAHLFDLSSSGTKVKCKEIVGGFYVEDLNGLELSMNFWTVIAGIPDFDD